MSGSSGPCAAAYGAVRDAFFGTHAGASNAKKMTARRFHLVSQLSEASIRYITAASQDGELRAVIRQLRLVRVE